MVRGWGDVFHSMRGQVELPGGSAPVYRVEFNNMSRGHLFVTPALSGRGRTGPDGGVDGWRHVARENMLKTEDPKSLRPGHLDTLSLPGRRRRGIPISCPGFSRGRPEKCRAASNIWCRAVKYPLLIGSKKEGNVTHCVCSPELWLVDAEKGMPSSFC